MATEVASLFARLFLKDELTPALSSTQTGLQGFGERMSSAGQSMTNVGASITALTAPLVAVGVNGIRTAASFDSAMVEISARTGLTGDALEEIRSLSLQMGADTVFSAQDAAEAFLQLLTSGQTAEQAMATLPVVLDTAAASGEALGQTADTLTDIMASFGIQTNRLPADVDALAKMLGVTSDELQDWTALDLDPIDEWTQVIANAPRGVRQLSRAMGMTRTEFYAFLQNTEDATTVSNSLARAAGASSADVASLGAGFGNVGATARNFGLSVNETAAVLAMFNEVGIKGAEAGTALRSMLLAMTDGADDTEGAWNRLGMSMYDAQGQVLPLESIMAKLKVQLDGMTDEDRNRTIRDLGETYGLLGINALVGETSMGEMLDMMASQSSAAEVAAAQMEAFDIVIQSLGGSVETLNIEAFTPFMNDVLKPLAEQGITVINQFAEWAKANPELTKSIIGTTAAIAGIGIGLTALGAIMTAGGTIIAGLGAGITALTMGFATFAIPVTGAALILTTLFGAINNVYPGGAMQMFTDLGTTAAFFGTQIATALTPYVTSVTEQVTGLTAALETAKTTLEGLVSGLTAYNTTASQVQTINAAVTSGQVSQNDLNQITLNAIQSQFSSMFGGARAEGGDVSAGTPYLVGEKGPELFTPRSSGSIMPNQQTMALAGGVQIGNIVIHATNEAEGRAAARGFEAQLNELLRGKG